MYLGISFSISVLKMHTYSVSLKGLKVISLPSRKHSAYVTYLPVPRQLNTPAKLIAEPFKHANSGLNYSMS